ncbi:outer membrane beta-barrel protein [Aridibaculum aurantiacum]|uniref:outer membrane beta-barrel protein n=1 Tax=Aridibaculum aurantiacum TaxID=2810307 RepID=UPI001A959F52|nr:outer membrane beta-barrel protein [Aridibaculum aurantiacum]
MKKIIHLLAVLLCFYSTDTAAQAIIQGRVMDTSAKKPLSFATISLVKEADSTLVTFTRADSAGIFSLKNIQQGNYRLSASYVGYHPAWRLVTVKEGETVVNTGAIVVHDLKTLGDVTVVSKRPPVAVNGDTLEFNAENFAVQPNAVVEDMLKKMPGVTVDADGTVRVNGQRIRRVLVNGKEFFTGDSKMATKNLPADAIDKVQVFEKKSDRAEFTGVDDGNSEPSINLKLKKDKDNAIFGKATASGGGDKNEGRYDGQLNLNRFKGEKQMSLLAMGNNTNRQGFSFADALSFSGDMARNMRGGGGITIRTGGGESDNGLPIAGMGNTAQGVANTYAVGANYNNKIGKKTDVNASYIFNDQSLLTTRSINRENLVLGNNFNYVQNSNNLRDNQQHRVNMIIDTRFDSSSSLKITPLFTYQRSNSNNHSLYTSRDRSFNKINDGFSNATNEASGFNFRNTMLYRKRLAKKGRTISAQYNTAINQTGGDGSLVTNNLFYNNSGLPFYTTNLDQVNDNEAKTTAHGGSVTYTEPVGKRALLELSAFLNQSIGHSSRNTFDLNTTSGKHDIKNDLLSNQFRNSYLYRGGSTNFRSQGRKLTVGAGATFQQAIQKNLVNKLEEIRRDFNDVLPNANVQYRFSNYRNIRLDYNTSTRQPSVTQLQPIPDISDPLNIREGNPALNREYSHNLNLNYFSADPATRTNFMVFANVSATNNAIVYNDIIDPLTRVRTTRPVNANGIYSAYGSINHGFPIRKLKSSIEVGASTNYSRNVSFINGQRNNIQNISITPNIAWNFGIDKKVDIRATARAGYNEASYSLQKNQDVRYWLQQYGVEVINYLPMGLVLTNNFNYTKTTGRAEGFNTSIPMWNATISKMFLKNQRGELRLSAFDLLNQNVGISRNANQNYIEDIRYNVLQRYFLLGFTYSLNKSGLNTGVRTMIRTF